MKHIIERLQKVMQELRLTSNSFAIQANISPSNMRKMLNGEQTITDRTLLKICDTYNVDYDWLKDGEGEPFREPKETAPESAENGIPYYEVENFACGTPAGFSGALKTAHPDGYFQFPWVTRDGQTFCVRAHGNSMVNIQDPIHSICHGSYLALRRSNVRAIQWGEVYALATADGYIIKKIMPSEREGYVRCVSFNDTEFPPYDLAVEDIYDYALVVGVATINLW